jgi:hypothetical protein
MATDWATISALATAGGTLVLAAATFVSVRSTHQSTRITERALLAAIRPLLLTSRLDDPPQKVPFMDRDATVIPPGRALADVGTDAIYLAFGVRNSGSGIAVLDRWKNVADRADPPEFDFSGYHRTTRDLYIPAGDPGFWQGAFRDPEAADFCRVRDAIAARENIYIDVLYGDYEGGQRTLSRFALVPMEGGAWVTQVSRHWNVDRPDPR